MRTLLIPVSWVFGLLTWTRNRLFDWQMLRETAVSVPVISVGNLTAGGTGKTPLVEYVVRHLIAKKRIVAVVSRGYGRRSRGVEVVSDGKSVVQNALHGGDEPVQIARKFPAARVVVGERRLLATRHAIEELGVNVVVLDDAFQHRYVKRDCNILAIDARNDVTQERLLPAGVRREALMGLRRADVVVLTRVESRTSPVPWVPKLKKWYEPAIVWASARVESVHRAADHSRVSFDTVRSRHALAFSGIADHDQFVSDLGKLGVVVEADKRYPDHHSYREGDIDDLLELYRKSSCEIFMTTEKDMMRLIADVRLQHRFLDRLPVFYTRLVMEFLRGEELLLSAVNASLGRKGA